MAGERLAPQQESILLIKTNNEAEKQKIFGIANELAQKRIFNPADRVDARSVPAKTREVIRNATGAESVEDLWNTTQDPQKTARQKELAEQHIDELGKAVFLVMYYGGNEELAQRVVAGSESVEEVLPDALKGLGDAVVNNLISSQEVRGILEEVDMIRSRVDLNNPDERQIMSEEISDATSRLIRTKVDRQHNNEVVMAKNYLLALRQKYGLVVQNMPQVRTDSTSSQVQTSGGDNSEIAAALSKLADRLPKPQSDEDQQDSTLKQMYDIYFAGLLHESPQSFDPFSEYAPDWMKNDPDKTLLQKEFQLATAAHFKKKFGNSDAQALFDTRGEATFGASNEIMCRLYEKVPGVRECLEGFMNEFFVGSTDQKGNFVLRLKGTKDEVKTKFNDIRKVQLAMQDSLVGPGKKFNGPNMMENKMQAIRAVSISWNLLYMGNVFEDADVDKWISGEAAAIQVWNIMHPARKAWDKIVKTKKDDAGKEEAFGGQKGQFLVRQMERARAGHGDAQELIGNYVVDINDYTKSKIHPFPERLFTSFFVHTKYKTYDQVRRRDGSMEFEEKPLAQILLEKKKINFEESAASSDPWGGYYDLANTARTLYDITTGKKTLVLEVKDHKPAKEMVDWVNDLADARSKVADNPYIEPYVNNPEFLLWSIAACVRGGLYPDNAHLIMLSPSVSTEVQYYELRTLFEMRSIVKDKREQDWVMKGLTCGSPNSAGSRNRYMGQSLLSIFGF